MQQVGLIYYPLVANKSHECALLATEAEFQQNFYHPGQQVKVFFVDGWLVKLEGTAAGLGFSSCIAQLRGTSHSISMRFGDPELVASEGECGESSSSSAGVEICHSCKKLMSMTCLLWQQHECIMFMLNL